MLNSLPTESIRQILHYLTVKETESLYQACGYTHKFFHQKIRSLCLHQFPNKMWLRLPCKKCDYGIYPYQYVPVKIQLREAKFYCAGECQCCKKRTCFQFHSIAVIKNLSDPDRKIYPFYVSENIIMAGYYYPLPEHVQQVGHVVDALNGDWWCQAVITFVTRDRIGVRFLFRGHLKVFKKTSPCLATHGQHTNPWNERNRRFHSRLLNTQWNTEGQAVYLQYNKGEHAFRIMEEE